MRNKVRDLFTAISCFGGTVGFAWLAGIIAQSQNLWLLAFPVVILLFGLSFVFGVDYLVAVCRGRLWLFNEGEQKSIEVGGRRGWRKKC